MYGVPGVRLITVQLVAPVVTQPDPEGEDWTVYSIMAELPISAGGDHEMLAVRVPDIKVAMGAAGAPGSSVMVTGADGGDAGLVPAGLVAVTVKV
jgi:hypothetical protein